MPSRFYDRQGKPIDLYAWGNLINDPGYQVIEQDRRGAVFVSTVWVGLSSSFGDKKPPVIFETMVFVSETGEDGEEIRRDDLTCRYATEAQARAGHARIVNDYIPSAVDQLARIMQPKSDDARD